MIAKTTKVIEWLCEDILEKFFRHLEKKFEIKRKRILVNMTIRRALQTIESTINKYNDLFEGNFKIAFIISFSDRKN